MICFPLDNVEYEAKALGAWFSSRTRGVLCAEDNLSVSAIGDMKISVQSGIAWLKMSDLWGAVCLQESPFQLTCDVADSDLSRIDVVCCRLNKNTNTAEITLKKGTPAITPVMPAPSRDTEADEIFLASVYIGLGVTELSNAVVTDLRLDESVCGLVRDGITSVPTDTLHSQAQAMIEEYKLNTQQSLNALKTAISEITAGSGTMTKIEYDPNGNGADITNQRYTHTALNTLTGTGANGYFKSAFSGTVASITIDGTAYAVKNGTSTSINLAANTVYSFILVDNTINFADGGARTLLWENASPDSVFNPQTINLDLSNYKFIEIEYKLESLGGQIFTSTKTMFMHQETDPARPIINVMDGMAGYITDGLAKVRMYSRPIVVSKTGIEFQNAVIFRGVYSTTPVPDTVAIANANCVPAFIYGGN